MAAAPLACRSLQMLSGTGSPRSCSPARGSPSFASPARSPRSMSPQPASCRATSRAEDQATAYGSDTNAAGTLLQGSPVSSPRRTGSKLSDARPTTPLRLGSSLARNSTPSSPTSRGAGTGLTAPAATSILDALPSGLPAPPPMPCTPPRVTAADTAEPITDAPDSPGMLHKQVVKLLARVGMDGCRAALLLQSPVDGIANELAYTASEMLLQKVGPPVTPTPTPARASNGCSDAPTPAPEEDFILNAGAGGSDARPDAAAALDPGPCQPSAASPAPVNPFHVNVMTVMVSTLLSGAAHAAVDAAMASQAQDPASTSGAPAEVHRPAVPAMSPAERLAMRLSSVSIAAALAKAPPLRAADVEDAFGVGLATTIGVKMMMTPGSVGVAPEVGSVLEGIMSVVHDSIDGMELPPASALMQGPVAGPWAGHAGLLNIPKPQI